MQEPDLVAQLFDMFESLKNAMSRGLAAGGTSGLTPLEINILELAEAMPGCTQRALVEAARKDKGQMARLLRQLENRGFLEKEPDPENRRQNMLRVTPAARPFIAASREVRQTIDAAATRTLGPEQREQLGALVARMRNVLDEV